MFKDRPTFDIVIILLTIIVGGCVVIALAGLVVLKLRHPNLDTGRAGEAISGILQTIVGALVGFIGGRAAGRMEANGV